MSTSDFKVVEGPGKTSQDILNSVKELAEICDSDHIVSVAFVLIDSKGGVITNYRADQKRFALLGGISHVSSRVEREIQADERNL